MNAVKKRLRFCVWHMPSLRATRERRATRDETITQVAPKVQVGRSFHEPPSDEPIVGGQKLGSLHSPEVLYHGLVELADTSEETHRCQAAPIAF